jgi:hypothetical protein
MHVLCIYVNTSSAELSLPRIAIERKIMNGASSDDVRRQGARELGGRADLDAVLAASRLEVPGVASYHGVRTPGGGDFQKGQVTSIREHGGEPESCDRFRGHFDEHDRFLL